MQDTIIQNVIFHWRVQLSYRQIAALEKKLQGPRTIINPCFLLTFDVLRFRSYRDSLRFQPFVSHPRVGWGSHHRLQHSHASRPAKIWGTDSWIYRSTVTFFKY